MGGLPQRRCRLRPHDGHHARRDSPFLRAPSAGRSGLCAAAAASRVEARNGLRIAGPVRLRQDDAAQHHLGPDHPIRGASAVRRPGRDAAAHRAAQHRSGVPVSSHLRHHDGRGEPGVPSPQPWNAARGHTRPGRRDRRSPGVDAPPPPPRTRADRRRQAEDLAGARVGSFRCLGRAVRRAADRDRPGVEMAVALEAEGRASGAGHADDLRHARPDGGADLR